MLFTVTMKAIKWWWFSPVQPSACIVAFRPFTSFLTWVRSSSTNFGIIRLLSVCRPGDTAAGMNSSRNANHSGLLTQEKGKPAEAVRRPRRFSNDRCFSDVHTMYWVLSFIRLPLRDSTRRDGCNPDPCESVAEPVCEIESEGAKLAIRVVLKSCPKLMQAKRWEGLAKLEEMPDYS